MFQFPAFASYPYVFESKIPYHNAWKPKPTSLSVWIFQAFKVGFPIRKSMDQSSFAAPHGLSQRITSFIACACQGIHQLPLRHLIVLIVYAHHLAAIPTGMPAGRATFYNPNPLNDAIDVFDRPLYWSYAEQLACSPSLRPASRDQIRYRAVRQR